MYFNKKESIAGIVGGTREEKRETCKPFTHENLKCKSCGHGGSNSCIFYLATNKKPVVEVVAKIFSWMSKEEQTSLNMGRERANTTENLKKIKEFQDETSFNVLLWKRESTFNYGRTYLNTLFCDPLKYVEENENYHGNVFDIPEQYCDNSSNVIFYHGIKDKTELEKSLEYLKTMSGGGHNE